MESNNDSFSTIFNRHKVNSAISTARVNLLNAILENGTKEDLGFDKKTYPPEKTIYYTLLKETRMHRLSEDGTYILGEQGVPIKEARLITKKEIDGVVAHYTTAESAAYNTYLNNSETYPLKE